jgi:hypothetical protein
MKQENKDVPIKGKASEVLNNIIEDIFEIFKKHMILLGYDEKDTTIHYWNATHSLIKLPEDLQRQFMYWLQDRLENDKHGSLVIIKTVIVMTILFRLKQL